MRKLRTILALCVGLALIVIGVWGMDQTERKEADQMDQQKQEMKQNAKQEKEQMPMKKRVLKEIREWVVALAVALLIVFVCKTFLFTLIRVDGHSMDHTLDDHERLFVSVLDVKLNGADRDDVIICHYPGRTSKFLGLIPYKTNFVKRVVAVEGDTVYRVSGATYVTYGDTGETVALDEQYAARYPGNDYEYTLGEGEYFVVGDNRGNSHDSRNWNDWIPDDDVGPITEDMLVGKVRFVFWPLSEIRGVGDRVE